MPEVAALLGVEYGEKFKLRAVDSEICENALFYFDKDNGFIRLGDSKEEVYNMLYDVVSGYYEVVKLPWEPKEGDTYYVMYFRSGTKPNIESYKWSGCAEDYGLLKLGMAYRTQEAAEAHLAEDYERLTGKPLSSLE